jgi:ferredoxin
MAVHMTYILSLSRAQWIWFIGTVAAGILIVVVGWALEPANGALPAFHFTTAMPIRSIAPELGVTNKALARELGLPIEARKGKPIKELGITQERLDRATNHLASHRPSSLRYYLFAALTLWGLIFLLRLGRPDGSLKTQRRIWYPRTPHIVALALAGVIFGFGLGKSPNPMEGIVQFFKALVGLYPSIADKTIPLVFFLALAIVGNKLVCGWACPFGALQELIYSLPLLSSIKQKKVPFLVSNAIRIILFAAALLLLFGTVGGRKGFVLYHSVNPFNVFNFDFEHSLITATTLMALGTSLLMYRPFCQFICPFGLISWVFERISLVRVRIHSAKCNQCGACVKACPLDAAKGKLAGRLLAADCYSCGRCLKACPQDAITYGWSSAANMEPVCESRP